MSPAHYNLVLVGILLSFSISIKFSSACDFKSIISFGDSITDTGNLIHLTNESTTKPPLYFTLLPYGETFFHHPTGRCSDGRLIIDFIAQELGLPFVPPFHGENRSRSDFIGGVNFAVGGATALEDSFFGEKGVHIPFVNVSLVVQIGWFKQFLSRFCQKASDCKRFLQTSLLLVGEIGGNDYNHAFLGGKSEAEVQSFVPEVIKTVGSAINELINLGATTLMVPGNFPIGCSATYLTYFFENSTAQDYDVETGCIKWLNRFAEYHNELLQIELNRIQNLHPQTTIIYADYYNATMDLYRHPNKYGFRRQTLRACCGGGGPYNVKLSVQCGYSPSICCKDPSLYVNWDGEHLTEAAHKWIAKGLFDGSSTTPSFNEICASSSSTTGFYDH